VYVSLRASKGLVGVEDLDMRLFLLCLTYFDTVLWRPPGDQTKTRDVDDMSHRTES
jgi:hypothetical protein